LFFCTQCFERERRRERERERRQGAREWFLRCAFGAEKRVESAKEREERKEKSEEKESAAVIAGFFSTTAARA
jgi:hypothetical protein